MAERRRLPVTCAPMVLFMTAFCALSVFQSLLLQELRLRERCGGHADDARCDLDRVASLAMFDDAAAKLAWAVPSMLVSGSGGALADARGKRPPMMVACAGGVVYSAGLAAVARWRLSHAWVWASALGFGASGGYALFAAMTFALLGELATGEARADAFTKNEAAIYVGLLVGPAIAGAVAGAVSFAVASLGCAALFGAAWLWVGLALEEAPSFLRRAERRRRRRRRARDAASAGLGARLVASADDAEPDAEPKDDEADDAPWWRTNSFTLVAAIWRRERRLVKLGRKSCAKVWLSFALFNAQAAGITFVIVLFVKDEFGFSNAMIGGLVSAVGVAAVFGLVALVPAMRAALGRAPRELEILRAGALAAAAFNGSWAALVPRAWAPWATLPIESVAGGALPHFRTVLANAARPEHQGTTLAAAGILEILPQCYMGFVVSGAFATCSGIFPGAPCAVIGAFGLASYCCLCGLREEDLPIADHMDDADTDARVGFNTADGDNSASAAS